MNRPLVSVHVPTYNQEEFILEAIVSAAEQNYEPLEVIVGDDGSSDRTSEIILECAKRYPDLVIPLVGGPHLGVTGNCNRILRSCKGKYIAFLDGDDVFLPGKIKAQVDWMEADERRVLCGHDVDIFVSETGLTKYTHTTPTSLRFGHGAASFVKFGTFVLYQSIMVRATSIPNFGFDERIPIASDWYFWICCLASGGYYGHVDGILSRYRRHDGNVTNATGPHVWEERLITLALVESNYPELAKFCRGARAKILSLMAFDSQKKGQFAVVKHYAVESLRTAFSLRSLIMASLAFAPPLIQKKCLNLWLKMKQFIMVNRQFRGADRLAHIFFSRFVK